MRGQQWMQTLKYLKKANPDAKKIYLFVVDYAFGWTLQKYVESLAPKYGLEVVGVDRHPLGHREYSTLLQKLCQKILMLYI